MNPEEKATMQDFCNQGCLQRLQIRDHQTERLEKSIQELQVIVESLVEIIAANHPDSFQRKINELTVEILKKRGPAADDSEKDKELPAFN